MNSDVRQYGVLEPRVDSAASPTAVMAVPAMGKRLYRPVVVIRRPEMIEALDLLDGEPKWVKPLVHLIASPYYYDFNADIAFKIDYAGIKAEVEGSALYEIMMLR